MCRQRRRARSDTTVNFLCSVSLRCRGGLQHSPPLLSSDRIPPLSIAPHFRQCRWQNARDRFSHVFFSLYIAHAYRVALSLSSELGLHSSTDTHTSKYTHTHTRTRNFLFIFIAHAPPTTSHAPHLFFHCICIQHAAAHFISNC